LTIDDSSSVHVVGGREQAEELPRETFLALHQLPAVETGARLLAWLCCC
jgi:hypothetical protein